MHQRQQDRAKPWPSPPGDTPPEKRAWLAEIEADEHLRATVEHALEDLYDFLALDDYQLSEVRRVLTVTYAAGATRGAGEAAVRRGAAPGEALTGGRYGPGTDEWAGFVEPAGDRPGWALYYRPDGSGRVYPVRGPSGAIADGAWVELPARAWDEDDPVDEGPGRVEAA